MSYVGYDLAEIEANPVFIIETREGATAAGVDCLAGPYLEIGENHLRRVYGRLPDPGSPHGGASICLYYWDRRDGEDLTGWWFGDSPGGERVWARCLSRSLTPPQLGWRVPWDSEADTDLFELKFVIRPCPWDRASPFPRRSSE